MGGGLVVDVDSHRAAVEAQPLIPSYFGSFRGRPQRIPALWLWLYQRQIESPRDEGGVALRTNTKLTALQVVLRYRNLLAVEQGFLAAKTLLATRPIFHRTDAAISGHIFCTFLALVLRKELMDRFAARHLAMPEWHQVVDDLAELSEIEVEQDGRRALLRTAPGPTIDALCRAVGITLPPVFQELPRATATT
jgi:hypothetical protein